MGHGMCRVASCAPVSVDCHCLCPSVCVMAAACRCQLGYVHSHRRRPAPVPDPASLCNVHSQVETCTAYFSISKQMLWSEVDADVLEETAKHLLKETNSKLNSSLRSCDAFQGLIRIIRNFLSTCPLILQLRQPSMRPRHWKLLQVCVCVCVCVCVHAWAVWQCGGCLRRRTPLCPCSCDYV
jgi:hypothetical protein